MTQTTDYYEFSLTTLPHKRLDHTLAILLKPNNKTRSQIQKVIHKGGVKVNQAVVLDVAYPVKMNDHLSIQFETLLAPLPKAVNIPIDIVYEDSDLIVINKPADLVMHPSMGHYEDSLVNALLYHTQSLSSVNGDFRPGIVHRLDKDTTGLVVVAKNNETHAMLAKQFEHHTTERLYGALVWGDMDYLDLKPLIHGVNVEREGPHHFKISSYLKRNSHNRFKVEVGDSGKWAVTHLVAKASYLNRHKKKVLTWVECKLETGRTHQIRSHIHALGYGIVGDSMYGGAIPKIGLGDEIQLALESANHQLLHAFELSFVHPLTRERRVFKAGFPNELQAILDLIEPYKVSIV